MSLEDAEKFVQDLHKNHPKVSENDVVIFVDYREDNRIRAAKKEGVPELTLLQALESVHVARRVGLVVRCVLKAGDVIIARIVEDSQPPAINSVSSNDADDDVPMLSIEDAGKAANRRAIMENINIDGSNAYDALFRSEDRLEFAVVMAYERKTLDDLISSSKARNNAPREQHLDEQIGRLLVFCQATGAQPRLLLEKYAENELSGGKTGVQVLDHAHSGLTHLALEDGVAPWHSDGTVGSARLLLKDARQIHAERYEPRGWVRMGTGADRAATVKMAISKSDNYDVVKWFRGCLEAIPRMSQERALIIMDQYPTMLSLIRAFEACADTKERLALISELKHNNRRLGNSTAQAVLDRFFSNSPSKTKAKKKVVSKSVAPAKKKLKPAGATAPPKKKLKINTAGEPRPPRRRAADALTKLLASEVPLSESESSSEDEDFIATDTDDDDDDDDEEDISDDDDDE